MKEQFHGQPIPRANLTPEKEESIFRVSLIPVTEEDLEYIRELRNKFKESFVYNRDISPEQQQIWWKKYCERPRDEYTFYVLRSKTGERMGTTSLTKVKENVYEFGNNILDDQFQGKGYFREVYQQALRILGDNTLMATVLPGNKHMQDVYRKFRLEETTDGETVIFSNRKI